MGGSPIAREILQSSFENDNVSKVEDQSYLGLAQIRGDGSVPPELFWDVVEVFRCSSGNQSIAEVLGKSCPKEPYG